MDSNTNFIVGFVVLAALLGLSAYRSCTLRLPLPPTPPGKLFSGNVHQLPKFDHWLTYTKWAEKYGPVFYFRTYFKEYVVLNSAKAITDLLESRSAIYSDRPIVWMGITLLGRQLSVPNISSFHPRFKIYRKQLQSGLNSRATQTYLPLMAEETRVFLRSLASSPEKFISHTRRNAGAVTLKIAYGWSVKDDHDYFIKLVEDIFRVMSEMFRPGQWLVDDFPWLRFVPAWVPGAEFQRKAANAREHFSRVESIPFNWTKEQIKSGDYIESFISKGLRSQDGKPLSQEEEDILNRSGQSLYTGGVETTVSVMTTFFLVMTLHPEVQQRAQAEIDRVVGKYRLPNINDQQDLPYIMAVIKEIFRWAPPVPLGIPHRVTQNDTYQGFRIPKGSTVTANIWAITRDSGIYPNPSVFDPERFLPSPEVEAQMDPRKWVFGFGRRVCPGAHFAETSIFLNISSVLSIFNISKAKNKDGKEIQPHVAFAGNVRQAKPFDCLITPRSSDLLELASTNVI